MARLTSEDRNVRATTGNLRLLRRALWRRWYLPGLSAFMGEAIDGDLAAQAAWRDSLVRSAADAARALLDARLADISTRVRGEIEAIKVESGFGELDAEARRLREDIPTLEAQVASAAAIGAEARRLVWAA